MLLALNLTSLFNAALDSSVAVLSFLLLVFVTGTDSTVGIVLVIDEHHLSLHIIRSVCASLLLHAGVTCVGSEQAIRLFTDLDVFVLYTEAHSQGMRQIVRIRTLNRGLLN